MFPFRSKLVHNFRAAARDRDTDERRLAAIRSAAREALETAEREKTALHLRFEQARTRATILAGTGTYEHEDREPGRAAELSESETQMSRAEQRLADLDVHIAKLRRIEAVVLGAMAEAGHK